MSLLDRWVANTKRVLAKDKNTGSEYEFESIFPDGAPDGTAFNSENMNKIIDAVNGLDESKGQPNGIATLNSSGKLAQMPTAADVAALPASAISSGSSADGYYLRLPGVLIQWASKTATIPASSGVAIKWTFPSAYSNYGYKVIATPIYESTSNIKYAQVAKPGSYYSTTVYLYNAQSSSVEVSVNLLVIGTV